MRMPPDLMSAMDHLLMLLEPLAICLTDAVEDDRDTHDSKTVEDTEREVLVRDGFQDRLSEALNANHRCDDHHRQCDHDGLINPCHDGRKCQWQLDLDESLPTRRAECVSGL